MFALNAFEFPSYGSDLLLARSAGGSTPRRGGAAEHRHRRPAPRKKHVRKSKAY
jgi:hypothetical protein